MLDLVRLLLPRACPGCGAQLGGAPGLCPPCLSTLRAEVSAHSMLSRVAAPHLVSLGGYQGPLKRALRALKFGGSREVARALAGVLAPAVPREWRLDAVCAVPLHVTRERGRGYNQSGLLARAVAAELKLPCEALLERTRATRQQALLGAGERRGNVQGAFRARLPVPARVLLVDDILTTSRTLGACADALRAAGAGQVYYLVAARGAGVGVTRRAN